MPSPKAHLIETIDVACTLGESILFRQSDSTVWWTDDDTQKLYRLGWPGLSLQIFSLPERAGSIALVEGSEDWILVAFETGFALFAPASGDVRWLYILHTLGVGLRMNDGRVEPAGRFVASSMAETKTLREGPPLGAFYRLDPNGETYQVLGDLIVPNGLCWSPSGDTIYYADSITRSIYRANYNLQTGTASEPNLIKKIETGPPDGAVTDQYGRIWSALWGAGCIGVLDADLNMLNEVNIDAPNPTCPCFGGEDSALLFVTSARKGMTLDETTTHPTAGSVFIFETGTTGTATKAAEVTV